MRISPAFEGFLFSYIRGGGGGWLHLLVMYLFICWSNRMVVCCFATILLVYAPSKGMPVLVLFVIFEGFLVCY